MPLPAVLFPCSVRQKHIGNASSSRLVSVVRPTQTHRKCLFQPPCYRALSDRNTSEMPLPAVLFPWSVRRKHIGNASSRRLVSVVRPAETHRKCIIQPPCFRGPFDRNTS